MAAAPLVLTTAHDALAFRDGTPSQPARRIDEPELTGLDQPAIAMPLALAAAGAVFGALLWAGIAYATGMEIGYVAWAIGGLVGGGMVFGGGRGVAAAGLAAALALVGIAGGKVYGTHLLMEHELGKVTALLDRQAFERLRHLAAAALEAPAMPAGESDLDGSDESEGDRLTEQELRELQQEVAAQQTQFARLRDPSYTFQRWRDEQLAVMRKQVSCFGLVTESLGMLDVLFVLLGLTTAFGMVQRAAAREGSLV